jgi:hypothetical protein
MQGRPYVAARMMGNRHALRVIAPTIKEFSLANLLT